MTSPDLPISRESLIYVEVSPVLLQSALPIDITASSAKRQLIQWSIRSATGVGPRLQLQIESQKHLFSRDGRWIVSGLLSLDQKRGFQLRASNPSSDEPYFECHLQAYLLLYCPVRSVGDEIDTFMWVQVTEDTMVSIQRTGPKFLQELSGELPTGSLCAKDCEETPNEEDFWEYCYNPETIQELKGHLQLALSTKSYVGTTAAMDQHYDVHRYRQERMKKTLKRQIMRRGGDTVSSKFSLPQCILVHSPDHAAGKSVLVHKLLSSEACGNCTVHVFSWGPLVAKFGVQADAALGVLIHQAVLAAAVRQKKIAIVLDPLESFFASIVAGDSTAGNPAWQGCVTFLHRLSRSLKQKHHVPFPSPAPLYNWRGGSQKGGILLPVNVCLVGIATCPDTDKSLVNQHGGGFLGIRYRFPALSASTRLKAFQKAFVLENVKASASLASQLPHLAAAAVSAKGADFRAVARHMAYLQVQPGCPEAESTIGHFQQCLAMVLEGHSLLPTNIQFVSTSSSSKGQQPAHGFSSVGGNEAAKIALQDALMADPKRRALLRGVGILAPTGVLLYGPPGTGKTLLARAIARDMGGRVSSGDNGSGFGGAFISLASTDLASAEVGTGEKTLVQAVEAAKLNAPSVIFLDEFQALFTERDKGSSSRLSSTLVVLMDDLQRLRMLVRKADKEPDDRDEGEATSRQVVLLAATNSPWSIDKAFLRPGRFDQVVHVGLPDKDARKDIYRLYVQRMKTTLQDETFLDELASISEGFSGADIYAHCRATAVKCMLQNDVSTSEDHFLAAFQDGMVASSDQKLVERLGAWQP